MSRNLLRKLNALDYSNDNLHIVRNYLLNGNLPETFSDYKKNRYKFLYKDFKIENGNIIYTPLNLQVINNEDKENTLKNLYDDPNQGIGLGIQSFYDKINVKYLNIKRKDVSEFLKNQSVYQINKPEQKTINKPIVGKYPNNRWAVDLIDMNKYSSHNRNFKWILTGIDYFSKKVFACPLKSKEDDSIIEGLEICIHEQMEGTYPKLLQADNGKEFKNNDINAWAKENKVKLIHTVSHTPTANALIENFNKFLRQMINEGFIRYNSLYWVDYLQEYINNRNDMKHTITKKKPNEIWTTGRNQKDFYKDKNVDEVKERLIEKAKNDVNKIKAHTFEVGDHVRATMSSLYAEQRRLMKQKKGKLLPVKFSPDIFIVSKIIKPRKNIDFVLNQYILKTQENRILKTEEMLTDSYSLIRKPRKFAASDLQRVREDQEDIITQDEGIKLNKLGRQYLNLGD